MDIKDIAKSMIKDFGFSVIPIIPKDKKPSIPSWIEFQKRRMTDTEVDEYFKSNSNIALITGEISGVDVLDLDSYKQTFKDIEIDSPLKVSTPRGGTHLYFKHKEGLRPQVNYESAIDLRTDGSYVLIPPSVGSNGVSYKWINGLSENLLHDLAVIPDSISKDFEKSQEIRRFDINNSIGVNEGERNDSLYRASVSLLSKHDEQTAIRLIESLNLSYNPPLSEREVQSVLKSALSFVKNSPPSHDNVSNATSSHYKPTTFSQDLDKVKKELLEGKTIGIPSGFPSLDRITNGYIRGQSYLIFADTNCGKSVFALNSLLFLAKNGIRVMYFDLENDMKTSVERQVLINEGFLTPQIWREMVKAKNFDEPIENLKKLPIYVWDLTKLSDRFGSITFENIELCIEEGLKEDCFVYVIDHLHYFEPSQKDYNKLADITRRINNLCAKFNIVILVIAHTNKGLSYTVDDDVRVKRPILDNVMGSGLITKHTKNVIGLMRNDKSLNELERRKTYIFVDKTKAGLNGRFGLDFNPDNLRFIDSEQYKEIPFIENKPQKKEGD
jgi:hypothetical protein